MVQCISIYLYRGWGVCISLLRKILPQVYEELSTRKLLVTEWIDGVKLSDVPKEELGELIAVGQESFLTQLLQVHHDRSS